MTEDPTNTLDRLAEWLFIHDANHGARSNRKWGDLASIERDYARRDAREILALLTITTPDQDAAEGGSSYTPDAAPVRGRPVFWDIDWSRQTWRARWTCGQWGFADDLEGRMAAAAFHADNCLACQMEEREPCDLCSPRVALSTGHAGPHRGIVHTDPFVGCEACPDEAMYSDHDHAMYLQAIAASDGAEGDEEGS